ncbi:MULTISPECIES: sensor domain-containing diguanylate cyclase [unclassified Sphingobium]|uniref:GGDEF domain-containing protein n=1 Tax=unclassified Sphingobium TaxID=2611147 RepID=UPI002225278A|nr:MULTISPECIES: GGDEF domain-containing protein [unclassified Sphingobium]MCW2413171.1 diguanylate cyclase [Sphingobium sp. B8D3D]MCW2414531.1 diguanylate cyclase [Sphingobium sp. B8D3A]
MSAAQVPSESFGGKLARLGRILGITEGASENAHVVEGARREEGNAHLRRESERRKMIYEEVGSFLFAHDLDLTPLNFGLALDYITGNDIAVEKAVRAILMERGKLTNGAVEQIIVDQRAEELTPDTLADMLKKVESNLDQITGIVDQSSTSAKDFGVALQKQAASLEQSDAGEALGNLILLTRSMIEKTREVESKMREGQTQTRLLQKNLESARKAAEQDHLTGLPNRRAFENTLREEAVKAREDGESLCVAFCDIDHFKVINDTHGHDAGDRVLKFVAGLLAKISGDKCHVARHGGEEFVMLFRGLTVAEAAKVVDDARIDMAQRNLVDRKTGERMDRVTFSGGVADVFGYTEPRDALKAADRALYLAKEHGRNRVYIAAETEH